jgi:hypothetical protein
VIFVFNLVTWSSSGAEFGVIVLAKLTGCMPGVSESANADSTRGHGHWTQDGVMHLRISTSLRAQVGHLTVQIGQLRDDFFLAVGGVGVQELLEAASRGSINATVPAHEGLEGIA